MHTPTIPGRGLAIIVGAGFLVASMSTLFGDDLLHPSAWTMQHYEVMAILLGATGFGLLSRYAKRARRWMACGAFAFLFVACTCLVVYKSLGRQAAATAMQSMSAEDSNNLIAAKVAELRTSRQRLEDAEREVDYEQKGRPDKKGNPTVKPGCGKDCENWKRRSGEVRSHIQVLEQEIKALGPRQVASPHAENFAQLLGVLGAPVAKVKVLAILFVPVVWTMVLEIGTIAGLEYGFSSGKHHRPASGDGTSASSPAPGGGKRRRRNPLPASPGIPASQKPPASNVIPLGNRGILSVLAAAGRPMTVSELARAMGVCRGEASKRWREAGGAVIAERHGRFVVISLRQARAA